MRSKLRKLHQKRLRFRATVGRFGARTVYYQKWKQTVVLEKVTLVTNGKIMCDHIWTNAWFVWRKDNSESNIRIVSQE